MPDLDPMIIPIKDLVLVLELSPRKGLNEEAVIRYMESFSSLPPVRVQAGTNVLVDGYHRVEAAIRLGLEEVTAVAEPLADEELRLAAGVLNAQHGQPLTRAERNQLAVALVRNYGKLREEAARLLGISPSAVTLALREHQFNEQLSEKLGAPIQVINSAHVRALYRVGPEQRERLLEAVVTKVDEEGQPYPLTGSELKLLVDRMLDPATPSAELNRLLSDPRARPKAPATAARDEQSDPFVPEGQGTRPWEREWTSPLKGGDSEAFDRVRAVDEQIDAQSGRDEERQLTALLRRAGENAEERQSQWDGDPVRERDFRAGLPENDRLYTGLAAAARALSELLPRIEPPEVRGQVEAVAALLESLLPAAS